MASVLLSGNYTLAPSPSEADVVIVNTCCFIDEAKQESLDCISEVCALKKAGHCRAVIVTGCLPQRYGSKLWNQLPEVDAFIGLDELEAINRVISGVMRSRKRIFTVSEKANALFEPRQKRPLFSGGPHAYLKIAEGCDHGCAFCVIPAIRGTYRSRPISGILTEATNLLDKGIRELNLISQDIASYGRDLKDGSDLPKLLRAMGRIGGKFWIRLLYAHPARITDELLGAINDVPQVCRYLDVPVQHSDQAILAAMRRGPAAARIVRELPERLRTAVPGITLRTACIVGYPGETEERFDNLLTFVKASQFDRLGAFVFSRQAGTRAFLLRNQVPADVAAARRERLMLAQRKIVAKNGNKLVGSVEEILIERLAPQRKGAWIGRSGGQAPDIDGEVIVCGLPERTSPGDFVSVRHVAVCGYDMRAQWARSRVSMAGEL